MRWEELSRTDAKRHLGQVVASLPAAVERLAGDVGEAVVLDCSRHSLMALWPWVLRQPNTDGVLPGDAPGVPPWYPFRAAYCQHYGVQASLVAVIDGVAAYYAACLVAAQPARRWTIGGRSAKDKGYAHYNAPVLQLGEHDTVPHVQITTYVERAVVAGIADKRAPDALAGLYDTAIAATGAPAPAGPAYAVLPLGPGQLQVDLPENLEDLLGAAFDTLDQQVAAIDGVSEVQWQDREVLLVTSDVDAATMARRLAQVIATT
ncbi:MAG TPA: hypothetical protein VMM13_10735 [Euzebya sp.]|nr:hypothetical protein [Euzebya sp.]